MSEHEELAALIDQIALAWEPDACLLGNMTASQLARAAALLREARPQPVPVAAPTLADFRRWWRETGLNDFGPTPEMLLIANAWASSWAARCAQPIPQPVPGWQPIDTAPHDGSEILASDYDVVEILSWSWDAWETGSGWIDRNGQRLYPAWWQPLPDHPPHANTTHPTPTEPSTDD
jgi:hypothetical protein